MVFRDLDKQALKQNAYTVLSKITLLNDNSVFTEDDFIVDWTYEDYRYVPDNGFIGQFVERLLDGNLQNIPDNKIFENQEINLKIGIVNGIDNQTTWYDYGNFLITKVKKEDTTGKYTFESADYTKKFNKVFDGNYTDTTYTKSFNQKIEDEETVTALWLAQYVCKQAGVVLYTTNFTNADFVISSNQYDSEDTLRKVMQDIGKLAYSWVRVAEDNKVHIDFTPKTTSSVDQYDQLSTDEYYVSKKSDLAFGPVNKVLIGMSSIEGENLYETSEDYTEETECAIKIYDNNLTNTEELRELALNGCERLFGIEYTPMEIETIGHPWLEGDELIKLTNVDNEILYTYPFNRKITYAGYIKGTIGAEATTTQDSEYEYKSDVINSVKKTTVIVDKQNQTITGLVEDVGENTSTITTLQESVGGISATVETLDNNIQDVTDQVNSVLQAEKTIKGNPVTIEDSGEYLIKNISFYGNLEQETEEEEAGTTIQVNGSATLTDVDTTKESRVLSLKGQTSQTTYSGKNLLPNDTETKTRNGITITKNSDGTYKVNGTATDDFSEAICNNFVSMSGTWRMLGCPSGGSSSTYMLSAYVGYWGAGSPNIDTGSGTNITYTGNVKVRFYIKSGTTCNNLIFKPMLTTDTSATINNFEPYVGGTTSPNPSYPQPVNVVSGDNYINICGKNLIPTSDIISASGTISNGITFTRNGDGSITANGTATSGISIYINADYTELPAGTYTFSDSVPSGGSGTTFFLYADVKHVDGTSWDIENFSTAETTTRTRTMGEPFIFKTRIVIRNGQTLNNVVFKPMLENGTTATTYEPYIGNSYPIYLGVENLFDVNVIQERTIQGITMSFNGQTIHLQGTATGNANFYMKSGSSFTLEAGTYFISRSSMNGIATLKLSSGSTTIVATGSTDISFTLSQATTIDGLTLQVPSSVGTISEDITISIVKGNKAQHISTTPIELCKIGTYQDYIYKDNGSWYLHKEIGKVVLNGSEYWTRSTRPYYQTPINDLIINPSSSTIGQVACNYFEATTPDNIWNKNENGITNQTDGQMLRIRIKDDTYTLNTFKEWLTTHNLIVYYVLATPTNTEITDTTLISQLDALESQ